MSEEQLQQEYADGTYNTSSDQQYETNESNYTQEQYQDGAQEQYQQDGETTEGMIATDDTQNGGTEIVAVENAMESQQMKSSEDDRKLFVGGISWDTESKDLKEYFGKFGDVTDVNIKTDPNTGKCRGFGFVTFASQDAVESVFRNGPHTIKGKQVDPKRAKAKPGIKKIFVGGLESDIPEADIRAYFEKFGKIETIELPFDKVKNQRRQFCFITFEAEDAVDEVCKQPKQKIGNKDCDIKKATPKPDQRSMRGGFGAAGSWSPRGGRGGRGGGYGQSQDWGAQGYSGYNQGYGYGNYGGYDYSGYGAGYGTGYYGYDYSGWNYGQGGYGSGGYGQQQSSYGKARRGSTTPGTAAGYHPYNR